MLDVGSTIMPAETLTLDGQNQTGILRIKKLPMPQNGTGNSSFKSLAGVLYEAQKRNSERDLEVIRVAFERQGKALGPVGPR